MSTVIELPDALFEDLLTNIEYGDIGPVLAATTLDPETGDPNNRVWKDAACRSKRRGAKLPWRKMRAAARRLIQLGADDFLHAVQTCWRL